MYILIFLVLFMKCNSDSELLYECHSDLDTDLDHHLITSGFHGTFEKDVACQQGTVILPDTWFYPFWNFLKLFETSFPELAVSVLDYPSELRRLCFHCFHVGCGEQCSRR